MARRSAMLDKHIAALEGVKGKSVEAGWFESDIYENGMPVAQVARINEFGCVIIKHTSKGPVKIVIPPRAFMRLAWKNFMTDHRNLQKRLAQRLFSGKITADQILGQIGLALEGHIVNSIKNGGWEPNAPATIANKGFDKPLIHTGHMWQTVSSKVID